jgi:GNAT superfamily N-acetyltransferase
MVETRHACSGDWELLKAIRLEALRDSPDAFCTTFDEALDYGDEVWVERSSADPVTSSSASILAMEDDEPVGMAAAILCDESQLEVLSLFVLPSHRGTGIAQDLMEMVEAWGRKRGVERVILDVEAGNDRAGAFYAHIGYQPTGKRETYPGRMWLHRLELEKSLVES